MLKRHFSLNQYILLLMLPYKICYRLLDLSPDFTIWFRWYKLLIMLMISIDHIQMLKQHFWFSTLVIDYADINYWLCWLLTSRCWNSAFQFSDWFCWYQLLIILISIIDHIQMSKQHCFDEINNILLTRQFHKSINVVALYLPSHGIRIINYGFINQIID